MWISQQSQELIAAVIRWHPCAMVFTDSAGKIHWANKAFCEWSGYSLGELPRMNFQAIHTVSDILQEDYVTQIARLSDADPTTSIKTQVRPKSDGPQWGTLHANRLLQKNETPMFWLVWEPLKNGTAEAFALAVERTKENTIAMQELRAEFGKLTQRDPDEDWILNTIRMARKYPKVVMFILGMLGTVASVFGFNQFLELGYRSQVLPLPPVPVTPQATEQPATGFLTDPMRFPQYAGQQIYSVPVYSVTTPAGVSFSWGPTDGMRGRGRGSFASGDSSGRGISGFGRGDSNLQFSGHRTYAGSDGGSSMSRAKSDDAGRI